MGKKPHSKSAKNHKLSRHEQKALKKQKQKEQDKLFQDQLREYQSIYGVPEGSHDGHMRSAGSQLDLQIEKSKRKSRTIVLPEVVVRAPDFDTFTEQEEEEKTRRELSKEGKTPRSQLRNALFRGLLSKVPDTDDEHKKVQEKTEESSDVDMPTTETVKRMATEQKKHSQARELGMSEDEESMLMEEDEDLSNADKINALKRINVETPYHLHYASTEQMLTLMVIDEVGREKYKYEVVLEDVGGVTDDQRKQRWVFGVDGTITSHYDRDLCIAVKNGRIAIAHRTEEETMQFSKTWRVVFIDVDAPTRHKYIALEKNSKLVLDMGRRGLALRVNKDTNDATQKWLVSE